jgi:hypothetical protein
MSLLNDRPLTEKLIAANQANAKRSTGPRAEGRARIRDANLRHGFYSKERDKSLRALGEKPEEFAAMAQAVADEWKPASPFQELLTTRLARALWRANRADRMQEGYALRQARDVNNRREDRLHAEMMRLKMTSGSLQGLTQAVAQARYVTTKPHLELMQSLCHEGVVMEMGEISLALFIQLQEPGKDEQDKEAETYEMNRRALRRIKEIFGLAGDTPPVPPNRQIPGEPGANPPAPAANPSQAVRTPEIKAPAAPISAAARYPRITPAEWQAREPVRQLLENLLRRQVEVCEARCNATLRELLDGPTLYERAAEIAPTHPNSRLMQRMEDSSFRQVARVSSMLLKIKRQAARDEERQQQSSQSREVDETKQLIQNQGGCDGPGAKNDD